jgi:hypothetical protein
LFRRNGDGAGSKNEVVYQASGKFASPPVSGADLLTLISTVQSGLVSVPTPVNSNSASTELEKLTSNDLFEFATPFKLVGLQLTIGATVTLPRGTLSTGEVTLNPGNATLTYSDSSGTTTLGITGTLKTTVQSK